MRMAFDIRAVVKDRLKLQSVQRVLENEFDISDPTLDKVISSPKNWSDEKKKKFIRVLGGEINTKSTKELLGI